MAQITPILVFAYNRPEHLQLTLDAIGHNNRLDECQVIIYCDGSKTPELLDKVRQTQEVAHKWAKLHQANVIIRDKNLGLKQSIISGVTQACNEFGKVIVLEDDIVVSSKFISFMLDSLKRYENDASIYQIAGFLFSPERISKEDAFFLPLTSSWGWATWKRAWDNCDFNISRMPTEMTDKSVQNRFNLNGAFSWTNLLEKEVNHQINSWAILFYYHVFKNKGLVVYPARTMVYNTGFDNSGRHCGDVNVNAISFDELEDYYWNNKLTFPPKIGVNSRYLHKYIHCIRKIYNNTWSHTLWISAKKIGTGFLKRIGIFDQAKQIYKSLRSTGKD